MADFHTMILDHADIAALRMALEAQSKNDGLNVRESVLYASLTLASGSGDAPSTIFDRSVWDRRKEV